MRRILLAMLITVLTTAPVFALTPSDIVELCRAGFEPERIARIVDATGLDEPIEAEDWVYLKSEGCSEELVDALLEVLVPVEEAEATGGQYEDQYYYDDGRADVNVYLGGYNHWGSLYASRWWYDPFWSVGFYYGDPFWDPYWTPYWYSSWYGYPYYNYGFAWNWGGHYYHNHHRGYCGPYYYHGGHYNGGYYSGGYHSRYKASRRGSLRGFGDYASTKSYRTVQTQVRTRAAKVTRASYTVDKSDSRITAGHVTRTTDKVRSKNTVTGQSYTTKKSIQPGTSYTTRKAVRKSTSGTRSTSGRVRSKSSGSTYRGTVGTRSKGSSSGTTVRPRSKSSSGSSSGVTRPRSSGKSRSSGSSSATKSTPRPKSSGSVSSGSSGSRKSGGSPKSSSASGSRKKR